MTHCPAGDTIGAGIVATKSSDRMRHTQIARRGDDLRLARTQQRRVDGQLSHPFHPGLGGEVGHALISFDVLRPAIGIARIIQRAFTPMKISELSSTSAHASAWNDRKMVLRAGIVGDRECRGNPCPRRTALSPSTAISAVSADPRTHPAPRFSSPGGARRREMGGDARGRLQLSCACAFVLAVIEGERGAWA